ncbi:MAG: Mut7-C RNAse domain-containing protein [Anaerolineae bacterium]|nr:Mut7-C RNAse domain-containing protein [Thermoflexus sp.]MDW8065894.1 Mut7-C RNAse domain-containing protein [Anaerolineae bacterium]
MMLSEDHRSARFVVDTMLGRLAKWLRILGYDTRYDPTLDDDALLRIAQAEDRILLTRDHALARRGGPHAFLVDREDLIQQLRAIRSCFGEPRDAPFSRCPVCNARLTPVPREAVALHVPAFVWRQYEHFHRCPECGRVYWPGMHFERMRSVLQALEIHDPGIDDGQGLRT